MFGFENKKLSKKILAMTLLVGSLALTSCIEKTTEPEAPKGGVGGNVCKVPDTGFKGGIDPGVPQTATTATINWSPVSSAGCSFVYKVYKIPNLSTPVAFATGSTSSVTLTGLTPGTTTQYVVRVYDGTREDTNLAVVNVTMPPQAIGAFTIDSITSSTNHQPTISWQTAANATSYKLEVAWEPTFATNSTILNISGLTTTSYSFASDIGMGKYWVKVTASASGTPDVVASNAPQVFLVHPVFDGCLQQWFGYYYAGSMTGWQSSGCAPGKGTVLGYLYQPSGLTFDPVSGYLYINNYLGLARWDMNSFVSAGYFDGSFTSTGNLGFVPTYNQGFGSGYAGVPNTGRGCTDGNYYYYTGDGMVNRISLSTQSWAGRIGGGWAGWSTNYVAVPTTGTAIDQFGGYPYSVACNSTDNYLYIADVPNHRISRWTKAGVASGVFGTGTGAGWSMAAGCCAAGGDTAGLYQPYSIHLSSAGVLYFGDSGSIGGMRLGRIASVAAPAITWLCPGGFTAAVSVGTPTCLGTGYITPAQMTTDVSGNIYVIDTYASRVLKFNSSGISIGGMSTVSASQSSPLHLWPLGGITVKPDGSLVMISDGAGARVALFDGNLSYLGSIGAGASGIIPSTTARPPTLMWSTASTYQGNMFAIDNTSDSMYFGSEDAYAPGVTFEVYRYSLNAPTNFLARTLEQQVAANSSPCAGPGLNPICFPTRYDSVAQIAASKTTNYVYVSDNYNGRVTRWEKDTLLFGGWIGNNTAGWQTSTTVANSTNNCSFSSAATMYSDLNGYLYVFDGSGNRVLVWKESDGTCIGSLGGGYATLQTSLVAQAAAVASKYFGVTLSYYPNTMGVLGDWFYIYETGSYTLNRYVMSGGDPATLTWDGWIGNTVTGWRTTNYAGLQLGVFQANTAKRGTFGAGGVYAYDYGAAVSFLSVGDGSILGKVLDGTGNSYNFSVGTAGTGSGVKTGEGQVFSGYVSQNYTPILQFDPVTNKLYYSMNGNAVVRYK